MSFKNKAFHFLLNFHYSLNPPRMYRATLLLVSGRLRIYNLPAMPCTVESSYIARSLTIRITHHNEISNSMGLPISEVVLPNFTPKQVHVIIKAPVSQVKHFLQKM